MKAHTIKQSLFLFILLAFLLLPWMMHFALAEEEGTTTAREVRAELREGNKAQQRAQLAENIQNRIINLASNVTARLNGAIDRFENIIARLGSRIGKLEALGADTNAAKAKLDEARATLESGKNVLENLDSVYEAVTGDKPNEAFAVVREELKLAHNLLKEVHAQLREIVALLKIAVRDANLPQGVSSAVTDHSTTSQEDGGE